MHLRPSNTGTPVSFVDLMALEKINEVTYRSTTAAFGPGGHLMPKTQPKRTYGGHVYAQAVWAAAQTMSREFVVHSVTGFFTLMGNPDLPFVYTVHHIRSGKNYQVRSVTVSQEVTRGTCFTCTASFKRPERSTLEYQKPGKLHERYAEVLEGKQAQDHPDYSPTEIPVFKRLDQSIQNDPRLAFPGLITKKVDMTAYNNSRAITDRRQLSYYAPIGAMPSYASSPTLHACAHLYASDRNSLFASAAMQGVARFEAMASLSHTVVFHLTDSALAMVDEGRRRRWMLQEAWTDRVADARVTHHSRLWDEGERHVATTFQDGMLRVSMDEPRVGDGSREGKL